MLSNAWLCAQSTANTGDAAAVRRAPAAPQERTLIFLTKSPVLALPANVSRSRVQCGSDGITFFAPVALDGTSTVSASSAAELNGVTPEGELRRIHRKLPGDAASVYVRDFYVADQSLVTLLEADGRPGDDNVAAAQDVRYLLSLSDHDGDSAKLVPLDVKFKPLKVARFGMGDFLIAGWDELNLLPVLALVKDDGSVRRFMDVSSRRTHHTRDGAPLQNAELKPTLTMDLLQKSQFVAFGNYVLLTFPGTREALRVWSATDEEWSIPLAIPFGTVLHDVLPSGGRYTIALRTRPAPTPEAAKQSPETSALRLFDVDTYRGSLLHEFLTDKPAPADMVCGADNHLTAMFLDSLPPGGTTDAAAASESPGKHWVIATTRR